MYAKQFKVLTASSPYFKLTASCTESGTAVGPREVKAGQHCFQVMKVFTASCTKSTVGLIECQLCEAIFKL
jgi:hypothetical protein